MKKQPEGGKMLLVFFYEKELLPIGGGYVLCWAADRALTTFITETGGSKDAFPLFELGAIDYDAALVYEPGAYVAELRFEDDGPGDAPGSREVVLQLFNLRKATASEWKSHLDGEWPWDETYE